MCQQLWRTHQLFHFLESILFFWTPRPRNNFAKQLVQMFQHQHELGKVSMVIIDHTQERLHLCLVFRLLGLFNSKQLKGSHPVFIQGNPQILASKQKNLHLSFLSRNPALLINHQNLSQILKMFSVTTTRHQNVVNSNFSKWYSNQPLRFPLKHP